MSIKTPFSFTPVFILLTAFLWGCDTSGTDVPGEGAVSLQFKSVSGTSSLKAASSNHDSLLIGGTNGILKIDDIRFIVAEFELEPVDADDDSTEFEDFESGPFFVDLPLGAGTLDLASSEIPAGLYAELEFEVEDLELDELDDATEYQALTDSIYALYADWPAEASMVITGSFTPAGGDPQSFTVFAAAEIEIELAFDPPLEVTGDPAQQVLSVQINPVRWMQRIDGTVIDLTQYDWESTGELLEFEAEFENGIEKIEVEERETDDDDDDEDDNDD